MERSDETTFTDTDLDQGKHESSVSEETGLNNAKNTSCEALQPQAALHDVDTNSATCSTSEVGHYSKQASPMVNEPPAKNEPEPEQGSTVDNVDESVKLSAVGPGQSSKDESLNVDLVDQQHGLDIEGQKSDLKPVDLAEVCMPTAESKEELANTAAIMEAGVSSDSSNNSEQAAQSLYHIKWVKWKGLNTPIVTQNENGPCPLLAIINVLLLQRRIEIPTMQQIITTSQLMEYIGDCILTEAPKVRKLGTRYSYSFFPRTIRVWNRLTRPVHEALSVTTFEALAKPIIMSMNPPAYLRRL